MRILLWACVILFLGGANLAAQRLVERGLIITPLLGADSGSGLQLFPTLTAWGGFAGYLAANNEDHAWQQKLGLTLELLRFGTTGSLTFASNIEFIADPNNDINFNPRAVMWEEGIAFTRRADGFFWQLAYFHRCKHDVDNLELGQQRALIYGSLTGSLFGPIALFGDSSKAWWKLRLDAFTLRQDDREPEEFSADEPNYKQLLLSLAGSLNLRHSLPQTGFGLWLDSRLSLTLYGKNEGMLDRFDRLHRSGVNASIGGGITVERSSHFRIGLSYEYLHDAEIQARPSAGGMLSIGISAVSPTASP